MTCEEARSLWKLNRELTYEEDDELFEHLNECAACDEWTENVERVSVSPDDAIDDDIWWDDWDDLVYEMPV